MNDRINILIASDTNYAAYYGIMLTSLFQTNPDSLFDIYFLTDKTLSGEDAVKFDKLTKNHNARLFVIPVNVDLVKTFPEVAHIKLPAYYHLSLSNLLPDSVHKIIYMDGDIIVNGDIRPLWNVDLINYACAQVINCTFFDEDYYNRLGYDKKWSYYNNGVSVYNLDYLREINFSDIAIRYINENKDKVYWMDQDAENALLYDKILSLPITYNFQTLFFHHSDWDHYDDSFRKQVLEVAANPVVIHYCGHLKPWDRKYYGMPYDKEFRKFMKKSYWPNQYGTMSLKKRLKLHIKRILFPWKIRERIDTEYTKEYRQKRNGTNSTK